MSKDYYENEWSGKFGNDYVDRCNVDYEKRVPIFKELLKDIEMDWGNVLEAGVNMGHNLEAINETYPIRGFGLDTNAYAISKAKNKTNMILGSIYSIPWPDETFDLVFTSGVLIHIPPDKIKEALDGMYRVSKRYIMMIEYQDSKGGEGTHNRKIGGGDGIWGRDYGDVFKKQFPKATLVKSGRISDIGDDGWDFAKRCKYWIFEK